MFHDKCKWNNNVSRSGGQPGVNRLLQLFPDENVCNLKEGGKIWSDEIGYEPRSQKIFVQEREKRCAIIYISERYVSY